MCQYQVFHPKNLPMEDAYLAYIHLKRFDYERVKSAADKILVKKPGDTFAVLLQM